MFTLWAQLVKNPPVMQETWVQSLGWEDPLEKGKAIHFSILPGEFRGLYSPWSHKESDTTERLFFFFFIIWVKCILELLHFKVTLFPFEINKCFMESYFKTI